MQHDREKKRTGALRSPGWPALGHGLTENPYCYLQPLLLNGYIGLLLCLSRRFNKSNKLAVLLTASDAPPKVKKRAYLPIGLLMLRDPAKLPGDWSVKPG
ncbi:MAG TPA: hypothetical protein VGN52_17135 [Burkholderiales bacterium]